MWNYISGAFAPATFSSWLSAIGTFAAAGVALWIATKSMRRDSEQTLNTATLIAARISVALSADAYAISKAAKNAVPRTDREEPAMFEREGDIAKVLRHLRFTPDDATLSALIPLESRCAHMISSAYGLLAFIRSEIDDKAKRYGTSPNLETLDQWEKWMHEAGELLLHASVICEAHAIVNLPDWAEKRSASHTATMSKAIGA